MIAAAVVALEETGAFTGALTSLLLVPLLISPSSDIVSPSRCFALEVALEQLDGNDTPFENNAGGCDTSIWAERATKLDERTNGRFR
jgi:hypothetical protein